jgi:signal transduction histidine kinase
MDTILIVDDVPENVSVLRQFLRHAGFEVLVSYDGLDALETAEYAHPDLILLDVMMPNMDGFETCQRLKQNTQLQDIPVIFMTALSDTENKLKGFALGAVDYITKPFQQDEVLARINTHLMLKHLQHKLQSQNEELIQLNQEKNELLGIAAHDLKNPLAAIQSLSEFMQESFEVLSKERVLKSLGMIHISAKQMFELVRNLLDVYAIESGKVKVSLTAINVIPIVQSLAEEYESRALAKNITLTFRGLEKKQMALTDASIFHQILDNLISNAVKYSPSGKSVWVTLSQDTQYVCCEIRDEGPGLSDQDKQKLFGKFARLTPRPTGQEHSTGLGLFIVKKLVEAVKGRVWCETALGQGATFTVEFPVAIQS